MSIILSLIMFINKFGGKSLEDINPQQNFNIKRKGVFLHFNVNENAYDAKSRKIIRLANPKSSTDAANKYYVDNHILNNDRVLRHNFEGKIKKCTSQCEDNYDKLERINAVLNILNTNLVGKITKLEEHGKEIDELLQKIENDEKNLNEKLNKNIEEINYNITSAKNSITDQEYILTNLSESVATKDTVENLTTALEKDIMNLQSLLGEEINEVKQSLHEKENDITNIRKEFVTQKELKTSIDELYKTVNDNKENIKKIEIAIIQLAVTRQKQLQK